ncbi:helix-turn-helix domain-containing protein [Ferrimonas kyonanensis]|uniref:helix-turn-helix domain-containing protein n=1 Tax=Ferrimonas kyonanensis TaxID=364763 RepID=UPI0004872B2D|nr:helix-turn-helix domain-containing protein [Ferrimonas kyonanensis]
MSDGYLDIVIRLLDKHRALTQSQLVDQTGIPLSTLSRFLNGLKGSEYVRIINSFKPFIYSLGPAGARRLGVSPPRYDSSVRALQHVCHRNQALFSLQKTTESGVKLIAKTKLYQFGLNPATTVECGVLIGKELQLLIVDDGGMTRSRIKSAWEREHKPHKSFDAVRLRNSGRKVILRWCDACPKMVIFTRDVEAVKKYCSRYSLSADVHYLSTLWEMGE